MFSFMVSYLNIWKPVLESSHIQLKKNYPNTGKLLRNSHIPWKTSKKN